MTDPAQTPSLAVDRLSIHVPAMSAQDAEHLAEQVAESLRHWPVAPSASGRIAHVDATVPAPQVQNAAPEAPSTAGLADQIATAVLEAVLRELSHP